jgi:hypothetical protein
MNPATAGPQQQEDERPVEQALRELLAPLDRHLERGRTVLAAALMLAPAPFILLWLLSQIEAKHAAGWSVLAFGVLVLAGLGWEWLMSRVVLWRFNRRFGEGTPARAVALRLLEGIESPNKVEEKLRDALGAGNKVIVRTLLPPGGGGASEPPVPLLELPPQQSPEHPAAATTTEASLPPPPAAAARPGGYYDYIPLEPLTGAEEKPEPSSERGQSGGERQG